MWTSTFKQVGIKETRFILLSYVNKNQKIYETMAARTLTIKQSRAVTSEMGEPPNDPDICLSL